MLTFGISDEELLFHGMNSETWIFSTAQLSAMNGMKIIPFREDPTWASDLCFVVQDYNLMMKSTIRMIFFFLSWKLGNV